MGKRMLLVRTHGDDDYTAEVLRYSAGCEGWVLQNASSRRGRERAIGAALIGSQTMREDVLEARAACPGCGDQGPHDDNGAREVGGVSFTCRACGQSFDAIGDAGLVAAEAS